MKWDPRDTDIKDLEDGILSFEWITINSIIRIELSLVDKIKLEVINYARFVDGSGRLGKKEIYTFSRK